MILSRDQLATTFGRTFPQDKLLKAATLAHQIWIWQLRSAQNGDQGIAIVGSKSLEFGANLKFQIPSVRSDDLEEFSDDDEDDWEDVTTSTTNYPSSAGDQEPTTVPSTPPVTELLTNGDGHGASEEIWRAPAADGVGGITLRWFWKSCEQAGQFSGDDLALAVSRVLKSDRSGDEVRLLYLSLPPLAYFRS